MKKPVADRIAAIGFVLSIAIIGMLYGIVSSWWGWFPAPQIGLAHRTMLDLKQNWRNDLALEPTRHLVAPDDSGAAPDPDRGHVIRSAAKVQPGYILVAGLNAVEGETVHVVRLYDETGEEVHAWPVRYGAFDTETRPQNVMLHGLEVFEDGSIAVTFDSGQAAARIDACGEPIWVTNGRYHHSLMRDGNGRILSWRDEIIVWLDEETGEEVQTLDLRKEIVPALDGEQKAILDIRTRTPDTLEGQIDYLIDPFHPNDAEPLLPGMADAFPQFEAGDVLISLREINFIGVVDPETAALKWWRHGPWFKQHDPDFRPDGTITVYDNATGTGQSKIRRIDPRTGDATTVFSGGDAVPFYSWRRGKHQWLENGNLLLTEAEHGRILELDPEGRVVQERHMVWDSETNVIVTEARHVPGDFFADGVPSCNEEVAARSSDL